MNIMKFELKPNNRNQHTRVVSWQDLEKVWNEFGSSYSIYAFKRKMGDTES